MNDTRANKGLNPAVLLLIPAAIIAAKAVRNHRAMMWDAGWSPSGTPGHGYGRMRSRGEMDTAAGSFRLPPRIESMLDAWHTRAHEKGDAPDATTSDSQIV